MNYITSQYAVSLFARSTLMSMRSFVVSGTRVSHYPRFPSRGCYTIPTREDWNGSLLTYEIVPGPPLNKKHFKEVALGYRHVGDRHCLIHPLTNIGERSSTVLTWRLKLTRLAPFEQRVCIDGPKFEVVDFSCGDTKPYSYARIGDPCPSSG